MHQASSSPPGLRYEYAAPERARAPVVLLPGLLAGGWMWDETWTCLLWQGFGVVRLVDPLAAVAETAAGIAALRAALQQLLDGLELGRYTLCGNSLGALVALDFAAHRPEAVESIVLSGAPGLTPDADLGVGVPPPRAVRRDDVVELAHKLFHDPARATPDMIDCTYALLSGRRHVHNSVCALRAARDYPIADALSRLACRALLVWGGNDTVTPAGPWKRMARVVGGCTFRSVQRCGHWPMIERPRQFNRILVEFLAREET